MATRTIKRHARVWLVLAIICGICWLVLWLSIGDTKQQLAQATRNTGASDFYLPKTINHLDEWRVEVPPINFETVLLDLRDYPKEFKDKTFFESNRKKWTVEVMKVSENKIIADYLDKRNDRDKFAYFRYTDADGKQYYVLTYGIFSSIQETMGASKQTDFNLPNSARTLPEQMQRYLDMIDNYVRPEEIDYQAINKPVKLKEAKQEVAPKPIQDLPEEVVVELDSEYVEPKPAKEKDKKSTASKEKTTEDAKAKSSSADKPSDNKDTVSKEASKPKEVKESTPPKAPAKELPVPPTAKPVSVDSLPPAPAFEEAGQ